MQKPINALAYIVALYTVLNTTACNPNYQKAPMIDPIATAIKLKASGGKVDFEDKRFEGVRELEGWTLGYEDIDGNDVVNRGDRLFATHAILTGLGLVSKTYSDEDLDGKVDRTIYTSCKWMFENCTPYPSDRPTQEDQRKFIRTVHNFHRRM